MLRQRVAVDFFYLQNAVMSEHVHEHSLRSIQQQFKALVIYALGNCGLWNKIRLQTIRQ